jgi:hypothetical protein
MKMPSDVECSACGWWPPMMRARKSGDYVVRASRSWRWRQLREHIYEVAHAEFDRGPHYELVVEMERAVRQKAAARRATDSQMSLNLFDPPKDTPR